jgi:hypothetical protein
VVHEVDEVLQEGVHGVAPEARAVADEVTETVEGETAEE